MVNRGWYRIAPLPDDAQLTVCDLARVNIESCSLAPIPQQTRMNFKRIGPCRSLRALFLAPMLAIAHGLSDAGRQRRPKGGCLQYVGLGASHMLTG